MHSIVFRFCWVYVLLGYVLGCVIQVGIVAYNAAVRSFSNINERMYIHVLAEMLTLENKM